MLIYLQYQNKTYPLTVEEKEIIAELKIKIDELLDISLERIELYHNSTLLDSDSHTLQSYQIVNESIIIIKVLPPQIKSIYLFPSIALLSICSIVVIYFSTDATFLPHVDDTKDITALISNCILLFYLVSQIVLSICFDFPIKKSIGIVKATVLSVSASIIISMLCYQINYNKFATNILVTIIGGIMCINCLMVLLYHHFQLSKCYNDLGEMVQYPTNGLFNWIACPNHLFEALFFTAFTVCCNFLSCSLILCVVNWIVMIVLSKQQLNDYKITFKDFKRKYALIPYIW